MSEEKPIEDSPVADEQREREEYRARVDRLIAVCVDIERWQQEGAGALMRAARKLPERPRHYIGEITRREDEPAMTVECKKCDLPRPQQLLAREAKGGETWTVLPCTSCPLDLGRKS